MECSVLGSHPRFLEQQKSILNRSNFISRVLGSFEFFPDFSLFNTFLCKTQNNIDEECLPQASEICMHCYAPSSTIRHRNQERII